MGAAATSRLWLAIKWSACKHLQISVRHVHQQHKKKMDSAGAAMSGSIAEVPFISRCSCSFFRFLLDFSSSSYEHGNCPNAHSRCSGHLGQKKCRSMLFPQKLSKKSLYGCHCEDNLVIKCQEAALRIRFQYFGSCCKNLDKAEMDQTLFSH